MPESLLALWGVEGEKLQITIAFKRACRVVVSPSLLTGSAGLELLRDAKAVVESSELAVGVPNLSDDHFLGELLGDHCGDIQCGSLEADSLLDVAIWQSDLDSLLGQSCVFSLLGLKQRVEVFKAGGEEVGLLAERPLSTN